MTARRRWAVRIRNTSLALLLVALLASLMTSTSSAADVVGAAGSDTALPATDSAVTVSGRGEFSSLKITVNQTRDLVNQAVSVTWTGGKPTITAPAFFSGDYLQILQCWGEDDGSVPGNPGPPPEQCVQGATNAVFGGRPVGAYFPSGGYTLERIISRADFEGKQAAIDDGGYLEASSGLVYRPFRAVDGTVVNSHYDQSFSPAVEGGQYWQNAFFNAITTNEIAGGRTRANGTGEELFEVATGLESTGLGCGQKVQPNGGGEKTIPKCWMVIVPRGEASTENLGTGFPTTDEMGVATSPLTASAWKNRISIPLGFNPIDTACDIGAEPRRLGGSELLQAAISSWQPTLCATDGLPPFTYATVGDANARSQLLAGVTGAPELIAVSRPIDPTIVDPSNPVVYSPLTVSALTIAFNIERNPRTAEDVPEAERDLRGIRVEELNLTPRLVAKLLTQSYASQTAIKATVPPYEWVKKNPLQLDLDPDFQQFNPEFALLRSPNSKNIGGLVLAGGTSDISVETWEWILADPEAKAWLDGAPDPWGMQVNPVYATKASANANGIAFADPAPDSFPKSDPYCFQAPAQGNGGLIVPPALCGTDWMPYAQSFSEAARAVRIADDGNRTAGPNPDAINASQVYKREGPQLFGSKSMMALVDTPRAFTFGLQSARLSRAGDNGADRKFIAPDQAGMTAAVQSMKSKSVSGFLEPDPKADAPDAYPLTALTYAAITPLALDATARAQYSAFLGYAVGEGQTSGYKTGDLPPGYAPLPPALAAQAKEAVKAIVDLKPGEEPPAEVPVSNGDGSTVVLPSNSGSNDGVQQQGSSTPTVAPSTSLPPGEEQPQSTPAVLGPLTAILALANNRFVLPILAVIAMVSALGATEITRRPGAVAVAAGGPPRPGGPS